MDEVYTKDMVVPLGITLKLAPKAGAGRGRAVLPHTISCLPCSQELPERII